MKLLRIAGYIFLATLFLALVLSPQLALFFYLPGELVDAELQPIRQKKITIRWGPNELDQTTNSDGKFRLPQHGMGHPEVAPFALCWVGHQTGMPTIYRFSPVGDYDFAMVDAASRPVDGIDAFIQVRVLGDTFEGDGRGHVYVRDAPLGIRLREVRIRLTSPYWRLVRWDRHKSAQGVQFDVVLEKLKKPLDRLYGMSYDGKHVSFF